MNKFVMAGAAFLGLAAAADARELTLGLQDNEATPVYKGAEEFANKLAEVSGGELSINLFPSATLGDFKAMVQQAQAGELDIVITGYPDMSYTIPELKLIGAPYVVSDYAQLKEIVAGPWGQGMAGKFEEKGIHVLDVWYYGTRQTTANKPINSIEDMKGLRLRTPNVPFLIAYAEAVGATPAPVAFPEVYLALQTNQVDAQENPLTTIDAQKFYEVQSSVAMTNHFVASSAVLVGKPTWDGLSDQEKEWVATAVAAGGDLNDELLQTGEAELVAEFEGKGLTVTHPDLEPFKAAMQSYYDELEQEFGEGSIAAVTAK
ncbi:MAG TPA: sialic acid TRAP transporter substrate-binding protein SiaP [Paracoccus sp. (in: a-proteobacteria)]|uniref:sialic acid TRAP transporter substrate-binding protein SiaP n=1 Tax=uncultured Paracoccus sp. TaxID=189685 RepID=UPI00263767D5|nr:sialic acid TRAP transporter substrate-binding protein SiaP [uncultured Paracoccus sp.]HMQ41581.1 sialic acid TRAP transporter substrate-binding protein SiaP [Paracoccus sp. (in: a-proteobacteria)]HMR36964.1 sialic acid TRAP transporter substrate-binding protein SiaP [Paracoccus sp. (in: a-proteobacteria)]